MALSSAHLSINGQPCVALNISLAAGETMHDVSGCAQTPRQQCQAQHQEPSLLMLCNTNCSALL